MSGRRRVKQKTGEAVNPPQDAVLQQTDNARNRITASLHHRDRMEHCHQQSRPSTGQGIHCDLGGRLISSNLPHFICPLKSLVLY